MKTKRTKKLLAFIIATAMAVLLMGTVVYADAKDNNYGKINGGTMTFNKYFVLPADTVIPSRTFNYTIVAGTPVAATATDDGVPIYAGPTTANAPRVTSVSFSSTDEAAAQQGKADDGITNDATKKYVEKTATIDFTGVEFSEPGIYRYVVTEADVAGVTCLTNPVRTVDVYVTDNSGSLAVTHVMYRGEIHDQGDPNPATTVDPIDVSTDGLKCDSYINKYPSQNLYVGKKIEGNQASKDKYFKFTITLTGAGDTTPIAVAGDFETTIPEDVNAATTGLPSGGHTNQTSFTTDSEGNKTIVYYLQGGQYVELQGVPTGARYSVTEEDYSEEGYVSTDAETADFELDSLNNVTFEDKLTDTVKEGKDYATGYTNTKDGTIPTGVILSVAGLLIVGIIAVIGFVFFGVHSKRRYEED